MEEGFFVFDGAALGVIEGDVQARTRKRGRATRWVSASAPPGGARPRSSVSMSPPRSNSWQVRLKDGLAAHKADIGPAGRPPSTSGEGAESVLAKLLVRTAKATPRDGERDEGFNEGKGSAAG